MGYHADTSPGLENNELSPQAKLQEVIGAKYFTTTGRDFPYCRKFISFTATPNNIYIVHNYFYFRSPLQNKFRIGETTNRRSLGTRLPESHTSQFCRCSANRSDTLGRYETRARLHVHHGGLTSRRPWRKH